MCDSLSGETVELRPLRSLGDASDLWVAVAGHEDLWRWSPVGPFLESSALDAFLGTLVASEEHPTFLILPRTIGKPAGYASYWRIDQPNRVAEIGNVLFSPELMRSRPATEALSLMIRHAFESGARRIEWKCDSRNLPSRNCAQRLGFKFEGRFRQHMIVKGENRDTDWFAMLDAEWPKISRIHDAWLSADNFTDEGAQIRSLSKMLRASEAIGPKLC